jgi:hypothetical protein
MENELMASCGMNCGICLAFLRDKRKCPGCRGEDLNKASSCIHCFIKNCGTVTTNQSNFCYECPEYPCKRLKQLDKRYRTKYGMSMLENLEKIKRMGIRAFVVNEEMRWRCPVCHGLICVHRGYCLRCGKS